MKKNPFDLPARRARRGRALLLVALGALCLAAPARADHNYAPPGYGAGVRVSSPQREVASHRHTVVVDVKRGHGGHHDDCACGDCCARRDYERGYERGVERGRSAGYRDGIYGAHFDDCATPPLDRSRQFERGFIDAFACAYRAGFEQGRRAERREHLTCARPVVYDPGCRR